YKVLLAKDYIIHKLTGRFLTDFSDASGTNAFDLNTFEWSREILAAAGIDGALFPEAVASTTVAGEITQKVAQECGLAPGTRVVVGGGDGMCASVGAGSVSEGRTYNCLGSSSWICTTSKTPIYDEQYRTFNWAHIVPGMIGPCGTMQAAGASFSWLKNEVCTLETERGLSSGVSPYELINEQIKESRPGANGLIFLPYLMGERSPRWNANARGAFVGLKMEHRRADMLRSVVEGIGLNLNIILQIMKQHIPVEEMTVIGGLAKGGVQRQILADIYGMRILRLNHLEEATSIGAAVTAGVGIGVHKSFEEVSRYIAVDAIEEPTAKNTEVYKKMQPIFDKAYFDLVDVFEELCQL
ncbi:MAG TPA: FGGY-family carbohydrate kinase, partial [Feifaniaceae bacterium]|nr:FGGY-family carbohydrate kinase [Feifaniaceae bacterium]